MVYGQPRICHGKWDAPNFLGFWEISRSSNLGQTTKLSDWQQQKKKEKRESTNSKLCHSGWPQGENERERKET